MAKPMPCEPPVREYIALLIPTRLPEASTNAPPELPGLIAASVWMKFSNVLIPKCVRPSALTMPAVTVWPTPKGLPIASTQSPTFKLSGGAKVIEAYDKALDLTNGHLDPTREILRLYGNMSSPTVLFVLDYIRQHRKPQPGEYGLLAALGPGFSAEQVLIRF